jgi:hypothetical protein
MPKNFLDEDPAFTHSLASSATAARKETILAVEDNGRGEELYDRNLRRSMQVSTRALSNYLSLRHIFQQLCYLAQ